jgi:hypothetical protein
VILDTYRDQQNGFVFGTNPVGIEYDGQVVNEGQGGGGGGGGRQQGGSGGGFNINWDGAWQVRTQVSEIGWSAEFAIPFRTLRYANDRQQTWGVNFQRNIRRRNETSFWAPLPRQYNLFRLSLAGQLGGLEVPPQRNLKLIPYVLGDARTLDPNPDTDTDADFGFDVKYSITPSLTLDGTYNTDFAQVEVDEQQINLDRFNLFFPEKRPFFLENAGLFSVGNPGETEIFFSRRIGIGPGGAEIPILVGARVTGNVAPGYSVGLLNMQTERVAGVTPANNFSVARLRRDLPNRSNIGAIFVNRQATGEAAGEDNYNRTYAADGRWGIGENGLVRGWVAHTTTPGVSDDDFAYDLSGQYNSPKWRLSLGHTAVQNNFNPEVGFLTRQGFRQIDGQIFRTFRFGPNTKMHEIRPHVSYQGFWNYDDFQETGFIHMDAHWEWKGGAQIHTGWNLTKEGVTEPFAIFPGIVVPTGTYDHSEAQIVTMTNQGAPLSFSMTTTAGGFFGGDRLAFTPRVRFRVGDTFNTDVSLAYNNIDLPGGSFETNLARARVSYSFTPRIFVQTLVQYNDRADLWSANLRLGWLQDANTGLFIVYNDAGEIGEYDFITPTTGRSLTIKFSRIFDILN